MISKIAVFISAFFDLSKALFLIPPAKISKFSPPPFSREAWVRRRFVVRVIEPWQTCFSAMQHHISRSQVIHLCIMAPLQRGLSMSKKASQSFASADAKALLYVFCRDMCVEENTLRGVSVELSAISGQQRRRTKRFFLEKVAKPLFRQSRGDTGNTGITGVISRAEARRRGCRTRRSRWPASAGQYRP